MNDLPVLEVRGLAKSFGKVRAVRSASLTLRQGVLTALLGKNGAGKTTTLKSVLGFLKRDAGEVRVRGSVIGYVPEQPVFFPWQTGFDVLRMTAEAFGLRPADLPELTSEPAAELGLDPGLLDRKACSYSQGNRKKFSYLQSLILRPDLIIVDEPFASLDPPSIKAVREIFRKLRDRGSAVLLSTHLLAEVEKVCDELIVIVNGETVIQTEFGPLRLECVFVRIHNGAPLAAPLRLSARFLRERGSYLELVVEKACLSALDSASTGRLGAPAGEDLDLEKLFMFFSG